ncbi:hypothetical protein HJC23_008907 [Cyclotella cryptica]|uniref:Protein kinase domain-containing protein n=1 Tax=Cyclotella cryptica TaxID=29204 RepID=A0ABD3NMR6_9STRA|eukprot:CCRYP_020321-RA/>CCRYP_020321-RA protein AED:0.02 eAED:0.02 QI:445/1/1/1/1/1/2/140/981
MDHPMSEQVHMPPSIDGHALVSGYRLDQRLGSGSFAIVYRGIRTCPALPATHDNASSSPLPSVAAVKAISRTSKKLTPKVLSNLDMEISILRSFHHPHIVSLYDVHKTQHFIYLLLEYCSGGDLQHLIKSRLRGRLDEMLSRRLIRDLSRGLGFLWERNLVHRDIKPQNLLLSCELPEEEWGENPAREGGREREEKSGGKFVLKIADFGFARHLAGVDLAETMCGSPLYMAPEILLGQKYDAKADLWSVGTVLFEMISGRTPFHGENHMDLLNNIKRKAVRLPPDVRVSKECVALLRILLDRKPLTRADFRGFYKAVQKFVELGCRDGDVVVGNSMSGDENTLMPLNAQMDLCAITEDVAGESDGAGTSESASGDTFPEMEHSLVDHLLSNRNQGTRDASLSLAATRSNAVAQVVTPPLNPMQAPTPPSILPHGSQGGMRQLGRPSIFAPLQGSPNLSPSVSPMITNIPTLSLQDGGSTMLQSRNLSMRSHRDGICPLAPGENQYNRTDVQPTPSSSQETYDSGFVIVEHSGHRSRPGSSNPSPSNSTARISSAPNKKYTQNELSRSPPTSSIYPSSQMIVMASAGMLGTSPATGQALVRKMMGSSPSTSGFSAAPISSGRFTVSPRSALRNGGCLAHIESLAQMLAAAEDVGRRAITIAHLGDARAYLAMGILFARRDSSPSSSSSATPMEEIEENRNSSNPRSSLRGRISKKAIIEEEEEHDDDELPFAMTSSMDDGSADEMSQSPVGNIMSNLIPLIGNNNDNNTASDSKNEDVPTLMRLHFREALQCYLKTLSMMKGSICAAQKVLDDVDEVMRLPSLRSSPNANNPYTPMHKRCSGSLDWLRRQFSAVLERADAASDEISKLEKANSLQTQEKDVLVSVEELIYNHSLKCGRDGAVKQILGHYDSARSCYRSAGLLLETLLMDPKVVDEDKKVLEGYVHSFATQILELDGLGRAQMKSSISNGATGTGNSRARGGG